MKFCSSPDRRLGFKRSTDLFSNPLTTHTICGDDHDQSPGYISRIVNAHNLLIYRRSLSIHHFFQRHILPFPAVVVLVIYFNRILPDLTLLKCIGTTFWLLECIGTTFIAIQIDRYLSRWSSMGLCGLACTSETEPIYTQSWTNNHAKKRRLQTNHAKGCSLSNHFIATDDDGFGCLKDTTRKCMPPGTPQMNYHSNNKNHAVIVL